MMKLRCLKALLALLIFSSMLLTGVHAAAIGTLNVQATDPENMSVEGFHICLIRVADADGVLTDEFSAAGISPDDMLNTEQTAKNAQILHQFVKEHAISGKKITSNANGRGSFENLDRSVYLVWAGENETYTFTPFLVFMPMVDEGEESWLVEADLKLGEIPEEPTEPDETTPVNPGPSLPQTGINKLPMYLLFLFGALFVVLGTVMMLRGKGSKQHE